MIVFIQIVPSGMFSQHQVQQPPFPAVWARRKILDIFFCFFVYFVSCFFFVVLMLLARVPHQLRPGPRAPYPSGTRKNRFITKNLNIRNKSTALLPALQLTVPSSTTIIIIPCGILYLNQVCNAIRSHQQAFPFADHPPPPPPRSHSGSAHFVPPIVSTRNTAATYLL